VAANEEKNAYVKPELDAQGPHPLTQKLSDSRDDSIQVSELPVRDRITLLKFPSYQVVIWFESWKGSSANNGKTCSDDSL
jgi:hypothetical protein